MKKVTIVLAGFMSLCVSTVLFGWDIRVRNSSATLAGRVDLRWAGIFCKDDTFTLAPGQEKVISVGMCDLKTAHVNYPWGEDMTFNKATGNPTEGLSLVTITKGPKKGNLKVVRGIKDFGTTDDEAKDLGI